MNIYQDLFTIVHQYIFGGGTLSANQDLVCITLATIGCVAVFALPFVVCWRIMRLFMR